MTRGGTERNPKGIMPNASSLQFTFQKQNNNPGDRGLGTAPDWLTNQSPLWVIHNWQSRYSFQLMNSIPSSLSFPKSLDSLAREIPFYGTWSSEVPKEAWVRSTPSSRRLRRQSCTFLPGNGLAPHSRVSALPAPGCSTSFAISTPDSSYLLNSTSTPYFKTKILATPWPLMNCTCTGIWRWQKDTQLPFLPFSSLPVSTETATPKAT